jgi:hypothetical protein
MKVRYPDVAMPNSGTERYCQAMYEWRMVLGQGPGNLEARLGLARAAVKAGDRAAAAQEYLRIRGSAGAGLARRFWASTLPPTGCLDAGRAASLVFRAHDITIA